MARVRTTEEVKEIVIRKKIKFSLVRQQLDLNRELGRGGCPTARGKVYVTSIFQKNGELSIQRPQLCLVCTIRAHLNQKDLRNRRPPRYEPKLHEDEIRKYCATTEYKQKCPVFRRFVEETDSVIVKRQLADDAPTAPIAPAAPAAPQAESQPGAAGV